MEYSSYGFLGSGGLLLVLLVLWRWNPRPKFVLPWKGTSARYGRVLRGLWACVIGVLLLLPFCFRVPQGYFRDTALPLQLVVDVSLSMSAQDVQPSRWSAAKEAVLPLLTRFPDTAMSLIAFSGVPVLVSPRTQDDKAFGLVWSGLSLGAFPPVPGFVGTALGDALVLVLRNFTQADIDSGVVLLITDGDVSSGYFPDQVLDLFVQKGIKIFVLGVGTSQYLLGYTPAGQAITTSFSGDFLAHVADRTQGSFVRGEDIEHMRSFLDQVAAAMQTGSLSHSSRHYRQLNWLLVHILSWALGGIFLLHFWSLVLYLQRKKNLV